MIHQTVSMTTSHALPVGVVPMSSQSNFWGNLIQDLREQQGISQRQLAAGAKVNRSTLRRIEEGTARGDIDIMERLLKFLGYELDAICVESVQEKMRQRAAMIDDPDKRSKAAAARLLTMTTVRGYTVPLN